MCKLIFTLATTCSGRLILNPSLAVDGIHAVKGNNLVRVNPQLHRNHASDSQPGRLTAGMCSVPCSKEASGCLAKTRCCGHGFANVRISYLPAGESAEDFV